MKGDCLFYGIQKGRRFLLSNGKKQEKGGEEAF